MEEGGHRGRSKTGNSVLHTPPACTLSGKKLQTAATNAGAMRLSLSLPPASQATRPISSLPAESKGPRRALTWPQCSCHQALGGKWSPKSNSWGFEGPRLLKVCWSKLVKGKGKFGVWVHSASTAGSAKFPTQMMTPTNNNVSVLNFPCELAQIWP